jgi:hypothetical protein
MHPGEDAQILYRFSHARFARGRVAAASIRNNGE